MNPASVSLSTTAPDTLILAIGATQTFSVSGGNPPYSATSNNSSVLAAGVSGNTLTLGGVTAGSATVTLRDSSGQVRQLGVTVSAPLPLSTTAPGGAVTIGVGTSNAQAYTIRGGTAPYTVTVSNPTVVSATLNGSTVLLTGLAAGSASVGVFDAGGSTPTSIVVTVSANTGTPLFTTAPSALTVTRGQPQTFSIGGGTGPYAAVSSNTGVITAAVTGTSLTLTPVGNGAATITVRDSVNSTPVSIGITVSSAPITLNPTSYNAFIGDVLYSVIQGGFGPYTAISGFPDVADVDIGTLTGGVFTANPNGNIVRIRVKQAVGSGGIIVSDSTGSTANITLTASAATNAINLTPRALTVSEAFAGTIQLMLYGAAGTTNIFTSHPNLITVTTPVAGTATGTAVTLTKSAVQLCADAAVTITAVDANGAVGTSTITIVNSDGSVVNAVTGTCP